jgi:hypothetical protein
MESISSARDIYRKAYAVRREQCARGVDQKVAEHYIASAAHIRSAVEDVQESPVNARRRTGASPRKKAI